MKIQLAILFACFAASQASSFCDGKVNGLYPFPGNPCVGSFLVCSNGQMYAEDCPSGLYYDSVNFECNWMNVVPSCAALVTPGPSTEPPVTIVPGTPHPGVPMNCADVANGVYGDPTQQCVNWFFICANRLTYTMHCPAGLVFDSASGKCNYTTAGC